MISKRLVAFIKLDDLLDDLLHWSPLYLESFWFYLLRLQQLYILQVTPLWFQ